MTKLHNFLLKKKVTLSLGESITGGGLAYSFVKNEGASNYFKGSIIAYSDEIKKKLLQIQEKTINTYGVVSSEVALIMAENVLNIFDTDISAGVTGFAGPSGDNVGKVFFAFTSKKKEPFSCKAFFKGDRNTIIEATIQMIHEKLYEYISAT